MLLILISEKEIGHYAQSPPNFEVFIIFSSSLRSLVLSCSARGNSYTRYQVPLVTNQTYTKCCIVSKYYLNDFTIRRKEDLPQVFFFLKFSVDQERKVRCACKFFPLRKLAMLWLKVNYQIFKLFVGLSEKGSTEIKNLNICI